MENSVRCVVLLVAAMAACNGPSGRPTKKGPPVAVAEPTPTAERPIALVYRERRGVYDLVFGGEDGSGRKRLRADENTVVVALSPDFRLAAVLRQTPDGKSAPLSFYDHDGREIRSIELKAALLEQSGHGRMRSSPYYRMWVGSRREAIVESVIPPLQEVVGVVLVPGKRKVHWVKADGSVCDVKDFPGIDRLWFTASDGFAVSSIEEVGRRLTRYSGAGARLWAKRVTRYPSLVPTEKGYDFSIHLGSYRVHFRRDGTFDGVKIPYDASAFRKGNPGYVERAGRFYEEKYLPAALDQLARAASLSRKEKAAAKGHLKVFIHEWLEAFVGHGAEGLGGEIPDILGRLDNRFRGLLDGKRFERYRAWRGESNALGFLFTAGRMTSVRLKDMIKPVELDQGASQPVPGQEPREKRSPGSNDPDSD